MQWECGPTGLVSPTSWLYPNCRVCKSAKYTGKKYIVMSQCKRQLLSGIISNSVRGWAAWGPGGVDAARARARGGGDQADPRPRALPRIHILPVPSVHRIPFGSPGTALPAAGDPPAPNGPGARHPAGRPIPQALGATAFRPGARFRGEPCLPPSGGGFERHHALGAADSPAL